MLAPYLGGVGRRRCASSCAGVAQRIDGRRYHPVWPLAAVASASRWATALPGWSRRVDAQQRRGGRWSRCHPRPRPVLSRRSSPNRAAPVDIAFRTAAASSSSPPRLGRLRPGCRVPRRRRRSEPTTPPPATHELRSWSLVPASANTRRSPTQVMLVTETFRFGPEGWRRKRVSCGKSWSSRESAHPADYASAIRTHGRYRAFDAIALLPSGRWTASVAQRLKSAMRSPVNQAPKPATLVFGPARHPHFSASRTPTRSTRDEGFGAVSECRRARRCQTLVMQDEGG